MSRTVIMIALVFVAAGCSEPQGADPAASNNGAHGSAGCPGGELVEYDETEYCLLDVGDGGTLPQCPEAFPVDGVKDGIVVCARDEVHFDTVREIVGRYWYLFEDGPCHGGEEIIVARQSVCVWADVDPRYFRCPDESEPSTSSEASDHVWCAPDGVSDDAVEQALGLHCAERNGARVECETGPGCQFVAAEERAILEDEQCMTPSENLCLYVPYHGNSAVWTCAYRSEDGVAEAFGWGTGTTPPDWDGAFEDVPEVCRCLDDWE